MFSRVADITTPVMFQGGAVDWNVPILGGEQLYQALKALGRETEDRLVREVRDGAPRRLRDNPAAAWFMRRQAIRMPAFGRHVTEAELSRVIGYIRWLRAAAPAAVPP